MKYKGSCHCQKVQFEVEMTLDKAMCCNCSICSKRASLLTFVPKENFQLISGEDDLSDYQFNKKVLHHYFCSTCGIASFGSGKNSEGKEMRAINIRCLDDVNIDNVPVYPFDGKSR